jgi:hypothetical protein
VFVVRLPRSCFPGARFKSAVRRNWRRSIERSRSLWHRLDRSHPIIGRLPRTALVSIAAGTPTRLHLRFTCLVPADSVERIALTVSSNSQLSVDMACRSYSGASFEAKENRFEACLRSRSSVFRSYVTGRHCDPKPPQELTRARDDQHAARRGTKRHGFPSECGGTARNFLAWGEPER